MSWRRLAYSATRGEILGLVSLISLFTRSGLLAPLISLNLLIPSPNFRKHSLGRGRLAIGARWPLGPPGLWPSSAELVVGGDGAAEPCAPPSSCSAWPCCGAVDLPTEWNREKLMGLWLGLVGGRESTEKLRVSRPGHTVEGSLLELVVRVGAARPLVLCCWTVVKGGAEVEHCQQVLFISREPQHGRHLKINSPSENKGQKRSPGALGFRATEGGCPH